MIFPFNLYCSSDCVNALTH